MLTLQHLLHVQPGVHVSSVYTQAHSVDNKLVVSYACTPAWG